MREAVRAAECTMIYKRIGKLMNVMLHHHRPQTLMGNALVYGIGNLERFGAYLTEGRIEIDSNLAANAIRPIKLVQKIWLFLGSKDAGHAAASIHTLVENRRRYELPVEDMFGMDDGG